MRRHAKASSAGSNMRQGSRLGRIVRGAFAMRDGAGEARGGSAPSNAPRGLFGLICLGILALGATLGGSAVAIAGADSACSNEARRAEQGSTALPDCRAYEMVSPADKNGADVMVSTTRTRAAADGNAFSFGSLSNFADAVGGGQSTDYMAVRGAAGWSTHAITPPQDPLPLLASTSAQEGVYEGAYSPDLSTGVYRSYSPLLGTPSEVSGAENLYLRRDLLNPGAGSYELQTDAFATLPPSPVPQQARIPRFVGASSSFRHVVFESVFRLTEDAPASTAAPKLYGSVDGEVRYLGQVPVAPATSCIGTAATGGTCVAAPRSSAGNGAGAGAPPYNETPHVVSADGSRVFFVEATVNAPGNQKYEGRLFLRDDGGTADPADDETVQLNASERTTCAEELGGLPPCTPSPDATQPAYYRDAAVDGSRAFLTTTEALTDDAPVGGNQKLYAWSAVPNVEGDHLTFISKDHELGDGEGGVIGVIGTSYDASYLYFVQEGQIVAGAALLAGEPGIYVQHDGEVRYLGRVRDAAADPAEILTNGGIGLRRKLGSRVSPSGVHLLTSLRQPPLPGGYDHGDCENGGQEIEGKIGCRELYLYDAATDVMDCISCNPATTPDRREAYFYIKIGAGNSKVTTYLNHPLSDDGRYAFFTSEEGLLPADTNGVADAYEYDSQTEQLHLLSSGTNPSPSYFLDASPSGGDVFIATSERLVGADGDQNVDVYDVRTGGGFPEPPPIPAGCRGEDCRGASEAAPTAPAASSAAVRGGGSGHARRDCGADGRRAAKLSQRAQALRSRAEHAASGRKARQLRDKADRLAKRAKEVSDRARRCRRANQGGGK